MSRTILIVDDDHGILQLVSEYLGEKGYRVVKSALLIGVVLTRHFMCPLNDLTAALLAMQQGQLEQVVPVHSQDELAR